MALDLTNFFAAQRALGTLAEQRVAHAMRQQAAEDQARRDQAFAMERIAEQAQVQARLQQDAEKRALEEKRLANAAFLGSNPDVLEKILTAEVMPDVSSRTIPFGQALAPDSDLYMLGDDGELRTDLYMMGDDGELRLNPNSEQFRQAMGDATTARQSEIYRDPYLAAAYGMKVKGIADAMTTANTELAKAQQEEIRKLQTSITNLWAETKTPVPPGFQLPADIDTLRRLEISLRQKDLFENPTQYALGSFYATQFDQYERDLAAQAKAEGLSSDDVMAKLVEARNDLTQSLAEKNPDAVPYMQAILAERAIAKTRASITYAKLNTPDLVPGLEAKLAEQIDSYNNSLYKNALKPKIDRPDPDPEPVAEKPKTREGKQAELVAGETANYLGTVMERMVKGASGNIGDVITKTALTLSPGKAGTGSEVNKLATTLMEEYTAQGRPIPEKVFTDLEKKLEPLEKDALLRLDKAQKNPAWDAAKAVFAYGPGFGSGVIPGAAGPRPVGYGPTQELNAIDAARQVIERLRNFNKRREYKSNPLAPIDLNSLPEEGQIIPVGTPPIPAATSGTGGVSPTGGAAIQSIK